MPHLPHCQTAQPWGIWTPTVPKSQTCSAVIIAPDSMALVAATRHLARGGYNFLPVREATTLGEVIYPFPATDEPRVGAIAVLEDSEGCP